MHEGILHEMIEVGKRLYRKNMVNGYEGNISVMTERYFYITPTGVNNDILTPEEICVYDRNTMEKVWGTKKPSSEMTMHREVYKVRPDAHAVAHVHSPYMTAFAMCNQSIYSDAHPEILARFNVIKVAPYGRSGTSGIVEGALPILQNESNIVLLGNHGALACGHTLEEVFNTLEAGESIARNITLIKDVGTPVPLEKSEVAMLTEKYKARFQDYKKN